jgi:hypothetical protein
MSVYDSNKVCFSHEQTKLLSESFILERNDLKQFTYLKHANITVLGKNQFE